MSSDIERDEESDGCGLSEEEVKQEQFMLLDAFIEEAEGAWMDFDVDCTDGEPLSEDWYMWAEYILTASAFFKPEMAALVQTLAYPKECFSKSHIEAVRDLLILCKKYPSETLSGEYPGGEKIEQVTS